MILPTKHIRPDRALIGLGAELLGLLREPATVSKLWDDFRKARNSRPGMAPVTYDWFVLAVAFLFTVGAVNHGEGLLRKQKSHIRQVLS
ncbi:MAG: ABC-three component system middle component 6 [Alphaproteobacteria bacterium]